MSGDDAPVGVPIGDSLDLHAFAPRDISDVVREYLRAARLAGLAEVRLIHGRGRGVQKARVHAVLAGLDWIVRAYEAPPERGGWGATIVVLAEAANVRTGGDN